MIRKKVGVISLGCDKNRVDTEKMLAILCKNHTLTNDLEEAEIIVVNTCAFLSSARKEAVEEILAVSRQKKEGKLEKLIVTGCLPQKYVEEIYSAFYEVDAFLGVSDYDKINDVIEEIYQDKRVNAVGCPKGECGKERVLTTGGYAYLKIADGCSNHCTYCTIPSIRGKYRSVKKEDLINEVKSLGEVTELILVAQDLTKYGQDLTPASSLVDLIRRLSPLKNVQGIRLLYCYPEGITDELIHELAVNPKMIRYIDIPFQHSEDRVLKLMNRRGNREGYLSLIERLKREVSGIAIRSTFIAGFPSESEEEFIALTDFLQKAKLFNAGFFSYSREDGTPAYKLDGQIKQSEKTRRVKKLYSVQKKVVKENYKMLIGKTFSVVAEGFDESRLVYYGRAYFNAPDVDGKIYFFSSSEVEFQKDYRVRITKASGYDLYGERV